MTRPERSAGFTLVETLASLAILALLSLMLLEGAQAGRVFTLRLAKGPQGEAVEAAQGMLRTRLERSFPTVRALASPPVIDFDGAEDRLDFVAPAPEAEGPDALWRYRLALQPNGELVLMARSELAIDEDHFSTSGVLLRGVAGLRLAYYGAAAPGDLQAWRNLWQGQSTLPRLIRARLTFPPGDERRWPDLLVRPAAELNPACVVEPSTGRCRGGQ